MVTTSSAPGTAFRVRDLARQAIQRREVRAENLDREVAPHAGQHLRHAHLDRLREGVCEPGNSAITLRISPVSHSLSGRAIGPRRQHQELSVWLSPIGSSPSSSAPARATMP